MLPILGVYSTNTRCKSNFGTDRHSKLRSSSTSSNHTTYIDTWIYLQYFIIIIPHLMLYYSSHPIGIKILNFHSLIYTNDFYPLYYIIQQLQQYYILKAMSQHNKTKLITKTQKQNPKNNNIDARFKSAQYDPKFAKPSANIEKVKIDKRFADKLQSDKFKIAGSVDKYGRKQVENSELAGMSDYYYTQDENETVKQTHTKQEQVNGDRKIKKIKKPEPIEQEDIDQSQSSQQENNISKWMRDYNQQSSDDEIDEEIDDIVSQSDSIWSDDDKNVIKNENVEVTRRLALCNYDWMNINSKDLMLLFSSFKPAAGTILSVTVYYSQIGKEKMQIEERYGPQGIWNTAAEETQQNPNKKLTGKPKVQEQEAFNHKKLRAYQKQRLKYCYAVIECNSKKTADEIYKECDGNQFESSNLLFDLRFIPDDVKFDAGMLKQRCDQIPISGEVKNFVSRAMGHSSVSLTWEDPELNETANLKKKNWSKISDKEMNNIDWSLYINEDVEKAEDNYNKIMKKDKAVDDEEGNIEENINVSDWRRQCNKKYKRDQESDDLEITFPSGFDNKIPEKSQKQSLNKQLKTRKERWRQIQEEKKRKQQMQLLVEKSDKKQFVYDPSDERFKAVLENPAYHIDPSNPKFDHRKVGAVFQEVVQKNKKKNLL